MWLTYIASPDPYESLPSRASTSMSSRHPLVNSSALCLVVA
jgi:hypothetical protein